MGQKEEIQNEALREFREWHDAYVPDHKFESHEDDENSFTPRNFIRHIHINHGPELERSIDAVKKEIGKTETIRHKYSTRFLAIKLLENDKDIEKMSLPACQMHLKFYGSRNRKSNVCAKRSTKTANKLLQMQNMVL